MNREEQIKMWESAADRAQAAAEARLQRKSGANLGADPKAEGRGLAGHAVTGHGDAAIKRRVEQGAEVAKKFPK